MMRMTIIALGGLSLALLAGSAPAQRMGNACQITRAFTEDGREWVGEILDLDEDAPLGTRCFLGDEDDPDAVGVVIVAPEFSLDGATYKPKASTSSGN